MAILQLNTLSMPVHCPEDKIYISPRNADFSSFEVNKKLEDENNSVQDEVRLEVMPYHEQNTDLFTHGFIS